MLQRDRGLCELYPKRDSGPRVSRTGTALDSKYLSRAEIENLCMCTLEEIDFEGYIVTVDHSTDNEQCDKLQFRGPSATNLPKVKKFKPPSQIMPEEMTSRIVECQSSLKPPLQGHFPGAYRVNDDELDALWGTRAPVITHTETKLRSIASIADSSPRIGEKMFDNIFLSHFNPASLSTSNTTDTLTAEVKSCLCDAAPLNNVPLAKCDGSDEDAFSDEGVPLTDLCTHSDAALRPTSSEPWPDTAHTSAPVNTAIIQLKKIHFEVKEPTVPDRIFSSSSNILDHNSSW